jgi:hypothetical protein
MSRGPQYEVGRYWGKITHQRVSETSTKKAQLVLTFAVLGKVNLSDPDGDLLACQDGERSVYRAITDATMEYIVADMDAIGWFGNKWSQFDENDRECVSVIGKELAFFCKHEDRNVKDEETGKWVASGELREVWSIAMQSAPVKSLDEKGMKSLDSMFGKALKGRKPKQETVPQPAKKSPAAMTKEELNAELAADGASDIPF